MTTLRKLLVELGLDASGYNTGLQKAQETAQSSAEKIEKSFSSIGGTLKKVGTTMSALVTAPIVGGFYAAVNAASDFEESANKVMVVFEDSADVVLAFAKDAAKSLGISEQAALAAAGTFGNLFTAVGLAEEASAKLSTELITLSADLASFNNLDPTDVLNKLRAGLTGETEPLKTLGININAAMVEAKALEMGLIGIREELTPTAKLQATYALILEQTTKAHGDFARTSDGLANMMRIVKARIGDITASMGKHLLPIVSDAVKVVDKLLAKFGGLSPSAQKVILAILGAAAAAGPLLVVFGSLLQAVGTISAFFSGPLAISFGGLVSTILPFIAVIAALIGIVILLKNALDDNFAGIKDTAKAFWEGSLKPAFESMKEWFGVVIPEAIETLRNIWENVLLPIFAEVAKFVIEVLAPAFMAIADLVGTVIAIAVEIAAEVWEQILLPVLEEVWAFVSSSLGPVFEFIADIITNEVVPAAQRAADWLKGNVMPRIDDAIGLAKKAILDLKERWGESFSRIKEVVADIWENKVKPAFVSIREWLEVMIPKAVNFLRNIFEGVLVPAFRFVWNFVSTILAPALSAIANLFSAVISVAAKALAGLFENVLLPAFRKVWNFISSSLSPVFEKIADVINTHIVPAAKDAAEWFGDKVAPAINSVGNVIRRVIDKINEFAEKLRNIKLPKWLTPGSPTPFEIGLIGIHRAMQRLNSMSLPNFSRQLGAISLDDIRQPIQFSGELGLSARDMAKIMPRSGETSNITYQLVINEAGQRGNVLQDFELLKAMAR